MSSSKGLMGQRRRSKSCVVLCGLITCWLSFVPVHGACRFPSSWTGIWFQSGEQQIQITPEAISLKGKCIQVEGDKFLTESRDSHERCFRCVVIHEKHINVLQYKETDCDSFDRPTLETLCSYINGDAPLFSMFRVNANAVSCPFHGTFTFTYSRGLAECRSPISSVDSCTEDNQLLFRYQACPDVFGSESTVETLVCFATWKEGSIRFLVGKLDYNMAVSDEDRFRCFVYEDLEDDSGYQVAQSGDATCVGLFSPTEGFRTMRLSRASSPPTLCEFPKWLTSTGTWWTLNSKIAYIFDPSTNATMNMTDVHRQTTLLHAICTERVRNSPRQALIIVHATIGCQNGYMCLKFYERRNNVIELQKGTLAHTPEDACLLAHFDESSAEYVTLLTSNPEPGRCPYLGKYSIVGLQKTVRKDIRDACKEFTGIDAGCDSHDLIEFLPSCPNQQKVQTYQCHASWEEGGMNYLITSQKGSKSKYCFMYEEVENILKFSGARDTCNRRIQPGVNGFMAFNITNRGDCVSPPVSRSTSLLKYHNTLDLVTLLATSRLLIAVVLVGFQVR